MSVPTTGCIAVLALIVAGCHSAGTGVIDPPEPAPPSGDFSVADQLLWTSDTLRISSEDFREWGTGAVLLMGDAELPLERVNETTMSVPASMLPVGTHQTAIRLANETFQLPLIRNFGYVGAREFGTPGMIAWDAYVTPIDGVPHVIGASMVIGNLAMINLVSGDVRTLEDAIDRTRLRGPGMTAEPGVWLLRTGAYLTSYRINSTPVKLAEHVQLGPGPTRQAARLSEDLWMVTSNQNLTIMGRSEPGGPLLPVNAIEGLNEPEGIHLSSSANRATIRVDRVALGVPVLDASTGELAYRMSFVSVQGVDFSANGSSMLVVGHKQRLPSPKSGDVSVVEILNPSDGSVIASRTLPHVGFAAAFDPAGDRVYVAVITGAEGAYRPALLVLDADLSVVATLETPDSAPTCGPIGDCMGGVVARAGDEVGIFHSWNGPPAQWRFSLKPQ
jgi:hypothetical protein